MLLTIQFPHTRRVVLLSVVLMFCGLAAPAQRKDKKNADGLGPIKQTEAVWPLPPDKPRIRFAATISGGDEKQRKQGFLDRVAGINTIQQKTRGLMKPYGIVTDSKGRIFVSDTVNHDIFVFDQNRKLLGKVAARTDVPLKVPAGLAMDEQDRLWVADAAGPRVYCFQADLTPGPVLGLNNEFIAPTGVAIDRKRHLLYVADAQYHRVTVWDTTTAKMVDEFGQVGKADGEFNSPTNIAVDQKSGNIYVVDTFNWRVQVFNPDLDFVAKFGGQGFTFGQFLRPKGVAVDSFGNVYITDADLNNVQIFDSKQRFLMYFNAKVERLGGFGLPAGIYIDPGDNIFVADQDGRRVQIFKLLDGTVEAPAVAAQASATSPAKTADPIAKQ